jgi:PAT family beta-lactamase induction signal transducer AmpG
MSFFRKPGIVRMLAFLLLYRLAEAQLVSLVSPFLLDDRDTGGLGLSTAEVGFVYGTLGIAMLSLGGMLGGLLVARDGLGRWLWPMALAINLPNLAYVWLASAQPESLWAIALAVGFEQFGYGFGFTAYMVFCMVVARGDHQTVHYALCTGFMAAGMMLPGMASGWIQERVGYPTFFVWVMVATIPGLIATALIPLDAREGRRQAA